MIDHSASPGIDISYFCDPRRIAALDGAAIAEALAGEPAIPALCRGRLADYNHVVLATERRGGRAAGLLAALDGRTTHETFVLVEPGVARADGRGRPLIRRMLAALVVRMAELGQAPTVIATSASDPAWLALVQEFGRRFRGATCFPQGPDAPIMLRSAALAQRVARALHPDLWLELTTGAVRGAQRGAARMSGIGCAERTLAACALAPEEKLALIDLRTEGETSIIEDAVRIYRAR